MPRRPGRPHLQPADRRGKPIGVRFREDEIAFLRDQARQSGRALSSHIAMLVIRRSAQMPRPIAPINAEAWSRLAATTSNLNQLTHAVNALAKSGEPIAPALYALPRALEALRREVAALRAELIGDTAGETR